MKKRMLQAVAAVLLGAALVGVLPLTAHANPTSVVYEGGARSFVFVPPSTDLFDGFKGVMPGDHLVQQVAVGNAMGDTPARLYLKAEAPDARFDELLGSLALTVEQQDAGTLFDGPANEPGGLADWVYLGTVAPGDQATLLVTLDVPEELGNEFQKARGEVVWRFRAEEVPAPPEKPKPTITTTTPQTGDLIGPLAATFAVAALIAAATITLATRKRNR